MKWPRMPADSWLIPSIILFLFAGTTSLNAQAAEGEEDENGGPSWQLEGLKRCFCVDFLMEPKPADQRLPKGYLPVPAHRFASLHPALERLVQDEPEYRDWIPSAVCAFGSSTVVVDGRRIGGRDPEAREMIGMWGIAGTPEGEDVDDLWVLHEFLTSNGRIKRSAEGSLLKLRVIDEEVGKDEDAVTEDYHSIKIGKTRLTWVGHLSGDSVRAESPMHQRWRLKGNRGSKWLAEVSIEPGWFRPMVGALRVEGKDNLAKALKASPIRMLGPAFWDGSGEVVFHRQ
ncbi:MAG: hypothetical protein HKM89_07600 [Gemmatimonadales bacterium]|nr:hypothetical protein [Gemmatimonadales bacterium]